MGAEGVLRNSHPLQENGKPIELGLSQFRQSMKEPDITVVGPDGNLRKRDMSQFEPFDVPAVHIFKIRDDRIHEIEALGFTLPYMSKNGRSDFLR